MASDITGLIADPEFKRLSATDKRQILSEADPEFSGLSDAQIQEFTNSKPSVSRTVETPTTGVFPADRFTALQSAILGSIAGAGGRMALGEITGAPVTRTEAAAETALEEIARIPGQAGELAVRGIVQTTPIGLTSAILESLGAIPKGTLERGIQNITQPALRAPEIIETALGIPQGGAERAKFREPGFAAAGEILGQTFPPIELARTIPGVAQKVGETALSVGKSLAEVPSALRASIEKLSSRGVTKAPLEDAITRAIGITAQEGSLDLVPIAKTRILEANKKVPSNALEAYQAAGNTEKYLIDKTLNSLKLADEQGLKINKQAVLQNAEEELRRVQPLITDEEVTSALQEFQTKLPESFTPSAGQKFLVEQNDKLQGVFNETGIPARKTRGNASVTARLGVADYLSNALDDIYKGISGLNESPYRDWGQVREFKQGLNDQIISAQTIQGGKAEKGITNIPVNKYGFLAKTGRAIGRPLIPREIEAVDKSIQRVFKEVPNLPEVQRLDDAAIEALKQKYSAIPPPLPSDQGVLPRIISPSTNVEPLSQDIQMALQRLGLRPSDPKYESLGRQLQARSEIVNPEKNIGQLFSEALQEGSTVTSPESLTSLAYQKIAPVSEYTAGGIADALGSSDINVANTLVNLGVLERTKIGTYKLKK